MKVEELITTIRMDLVQQSSGDYLPMVMRAGLGWRSSSGTEKCKRLPEPTSKGKRHRQERYAETPIPRERSQLDLGVPLRLAVS